MPESVLELITHVAAMLLLAVPLLWTTWKRKKYGAFPPIRVTLKLLCFAVVAWLLAHGISALMRQVLPDMVEPDARQGRMTGERRHCPWPLILGKEHPDAPFPVKDPIRIHVPGKVCD